MNRRVLTAKVLEDGEGSMSESRCVVMIYDGEHSYVIEIFAGRGDFSELPLIVRRDGRQHIYIDISEFCDDGGRAEHSRYGNTTWHVDRPKNPNYEVGK